MAQLFIVRPIILSARYYCPPDTTVRPILLSARYYCPPDTTVRPILLSARYYCPPDTTVRPILLSARYYCPPDTTVRPILLSARYYCPPDTTVRPILLSARYYCPLAPPEERWRKFFVHHLPGRGSVALVGSVECYRRGLHQFEEIVVESKAPFGLFRRRRRLTTSLSVLVYPQVFALEKIPLVEAIQGTQTRPQKTRVGQEIAGTRRYFPGDPPRHIHWRNAAREGRQEFEDSQEDTLIIGFDSSADSGDGRETVLEYSIKLAASVAGYIAGRGGGVRLVTGGLTDQELAWPVLLKELALLEVRKGSSDAGPR